MAGTIGPHETRRSLPQRLLTRTSMHYTAAAMPPGSDPSAWADLLDGEPPWAGRRTRPRLVVPGPELTLASLRCDLTLVVEASRRGQGDLVVDDRLEFHPRALAGAIERERSRMGRRIEEARKRARRREVRASRVSAHAHRLLGAVLGTTRRVTRGTMALPDNVLNRARKSAAFMHEPGARDRLKRGYLDPHSLSPREKGVALSLGVTAVLGTLVTLHLAVTLVTPHLAVPWRAAFLLFLYAFLTAVGIPLPIEPALVLGALAIGPAPALLVTLTSKVTAAWLVFFLGDEIGHKIRARAQRSATFARLLGRSERFARSYGTFAMALFLATPGLPDAFALYVFGSLHMPLWKYLLGVAIGGTILYSAILFGLLPLLGL